MADPRATLAAEWAVVRAWVAAVPPELLDRPSVLEGWTVRDLVAHLGRAIGMLGATSVADRGVAPMSFAAYCTAYPVNADAIADHTRELARERRDTLGELLDEGWSAATEALDVWGDSSGTVVQARRGPIRSADLVDSRTLELVVHGDDLARSLPELVAPVHERSALRAVVKLLLGVLVERSPGRTVEVRVPPFAAVQCVQGPSHTRGTPPNTVEADPLGFIRLACGRVPWAEAVADGSVRASGGRADLSGLLPLL